MCFRTFWREVDTGPGATPWLIANSSEEPSSRAAEHPHRWLDSSREETNGYNTLASEKLSPHTYAGNGHPLPPAPARSERDAQDHMGPLSRTALHFERRIQQARAPGHVAQAVTCARPGIKPATVVFDLQDQVGPLRFQRDIGVAGLRMPCDVVHALLEDEEDLAPRFHAEAEFPFLLGNRKMKGIHSPRGSRLQTSACAA